MVECKNKLRCKKYNNSRFCEVCVHNAKAKLKDNFIDRGYIPACKYGYDDCIHDPALLLYDYDDCAWTKKNYTKEQLIKEIEEGCSCEDGCNYDDEDK